MIRYYFVDIIREMFIYQIHVYYVCNQKNDRPLAFFSTFVLELKTKLLPQIDKLRYVVAGV